MFSLSRVADTASTPEDKSVSSDISNVFDSIAKGLGQTVATPLTSLSNSSLTGVKNWTVVNIAAQDQYMETGAYTGCLGKGANLWISNPTGASHTINVGVGSSNTINGGTTAVTIPAWTSLRKANFTVSAAGVADLNLNVP